MNQTPKVKFVEAFKLFWLNYVNFKGRSRRSEYWWVMLWHTIISVSIIFLAIALMFVPPIGIFISGILFIVIFLYSLATIIPNLALEVRRCHDRGLTMLLPILSFIISIAYSVISAIVPSELLFYEENFSVSTMTQPDSAWLFWILTVIMAVSVILQIVLFVITLLDSKQETNQYGPSPKYVTAQYEGHNDHYRTKQHDSEKPEEHLRTLETNTQHKDQDDPYRY
ncbi:DUF805 domain-containing protein [Staphylococcus sp. 17KM0847]|uniref:DUF805 domain-containing protein n=1 Tax=Staphylococcus sp. 17KM0847 TaxID=2583989 RepID=UPI0015DCA6C1|nr:DUF805 domain-containing protein [Staphylococcus sp. 17KM0847]QLK86702.1 DUF805 domain-containing protein [Staphylococcus sp. 17KM0847]